MEVRSTTEKCAKTDSTMNCKNNDVKLNPTAEPFGSNATSTVTETSTIQSKTTANENKCEIMDSAMSRDERLVAELKSHIPDVDNIFQIHRRIGEGTFSTVFLTSLRCQQHVPAKKRRFFALKYLVPTSHPKRVAQELRCLKEIGGQNSVVGVDLCLRNNDAIAFVMPYLQHDRFQDYFDKLNPSELQLYMRNLLIALRHVHGFGVIHRDVKPSNFLHDRKNQKYLLVDFGLAQTLEPESTKSLTNSNDESNQVKQQKPQSSIRFDQEISESNALANENKRKKPDDIDTNGNDKPFIDNPSKRICTLASQVATSHAAVAVDSKIYNQSTANQNLSHDLVDKQQQQQQLNPEPPNSVQPVQHIPSPFKEPLKQLNEISTPKNPINIDSTLAVHNLNSVNEPNAGEKQIISTATPTLNEDSAKKIDEPKQLKTVAPQKYIVDNRRTTSSGNANGNCHCHGRPTVCNLCIIRREIHAPRAGTPGYRPSEVLLKYPKQTTAVDIWAAGVILISILSGCYPFFKGTDDFNALAEIITVFGDEVVKKTAESLGRHVCISRKKRPLHLRKLCVRLRNRYKMQNTPSKEGNSNSTKMNKMCDNCEQMNINCLCQDTDYNLDFSSDIYPDSVYDLLDKLLAICPSKRINATDALEHAFFKEMF